MAGDSSLNRKANLHEMLEFGKRSDLRVKKLKAGEEEKIALKNEISSLQKKYEDVERNLEIQQEKMSRLKMEEYSLTKENEYLEEIEAQSLHEKCEKENELWGVRQSVYTDLAHYCDKILNVTKDHSLKNMKEFIEAKQKREIFAECSVSNPFAQAYAESYKQNEPGKKNKLLGEISKLKSELENLRLKEAEVSKARARKYELKFEPVNGSEFIRLQNLLKDLRDDIQNMNTEIYSLEKEINSTKSVERATREHEASQAPKQNQKEDVGVISSSYGNLTRDSARFGLTPSTPNQASVIGDSSIPMTDQTNTLKRASKSNAYVYKSPSKYFKKNKID